MNIHKQDVHSAFIKVFQVKGKEHLAVTVMSAFPFDRPGNLLDESELWSTAGLSLSTHDVLDMFMPKQKGEVLAAGKFFSLGGQPVRAGYVQITVGSVTKALHVLGDRRWIRKAGLVRGISDPEPMKQVSVTYENAFGGSGYKGNPLGKGLETVGTEGTIPLPNIEYPDQLIISPSDRPEPAGFGPLGLDWQQRTRKLGTYDRKWLQTRWPWFPEDMDWTYFNAAPEDQQIPGYFKGDESIVIENMHPQRSIIHTSLPGLRMRCFISRAKNSAEVFEELDTRLDTVWILPEYEMGVVIWRGTVEVQDDEAEDVEAVFLAHEALAAERKPIEYYRDIFLSGGQGEGVVEGSGAVVPPPEEESGLITKPVKPPAAGTVRDPETDALIKKLEKRIADSETQVMAELRRLGVDPEHVMKELKLVAGLPLTDSSPPSAEMSVSGLEKGIARCEAELNEMVKTFGFQPDKLMDAAKEVDRTKAPSMKDLIGKIQEAGIRDPEIERHLLEIEKEEDEARKELASLLKEQESQEGGPGKEASGKEEEVKEKLTPEVEEEYTREKVLECYGEGKSLAGKDLSGLDLSALDLSRIDFRAAMLEKVNMSGTILVGARLSGAILTGADLSKAKFVRADLSAVNLSQVRGAEADFSGSDLRAADLERGHLPGADFTEATMDDVNFQEAILKGAVFERASGRGARFLGADLAGARFVEADVAGADFSGANLDRADFSGCKMPSSTFDGAKGKNVRFTGAALQESRADKTTVFKETDFQKTDLSGANWEGASLDGARFNHALLQMADFSHCHLDSSDFYRAVARQARFTGASLEKANMTSINLFRGDLSKARLVKTDFKGANLFEVEFLKATVREVNFRDANLKRTKLAHWTPE